MKTKHHLTPEILQNLYIEQGKTMQEIADDYGCSLKVVWSRCKRWGIRSRPGCTQWNGGVLSDHHGYVLLYYPHHPHCNKKGYVREHRLVMEKVLGRFLRPEEVVHHKDGNTSNNHPDNLELFENNGAHLATTMKGKRPKWTEDGLRRMRAGVEKRVCKQLPPPEVIVEMYKTKSANDIAREYGCSQKPVADRLRAAGVNLRGMRDKFAHQWPAVERVREMLDTMTPREVSSSLGKKEKTLYAWLKRNGIDWKHRTHCSKSPLSKPTANPK